MASEFPQTITNIAVDALAGNRRLRADCLFGKYFWKAGIIVLNGLRKGGIPTLDLPCQHAFIHVCNRNTGGR